VAFKALEETVLPALIHKQKDTQRSLCIWSAGCATGEEPYSIAMLLMELMGNDIERWNVTIMATDIDTKALQRAQDGLFSQKDVESIQQAWRDKYFVSENKSFRVLPAVRQMVTFEVHNLVSDLPYHDLDLVVCEYPESAGLEDHLIKMKKIITEFKPNRIAVDSLSALERVSTIKGFREFVIGLTSYIKHHEVAGLFTATTLSLMGGTSITEAHISTITDSIILLRYVEMYGEMQRGLTVLKMRGSKHDKDIRRFTIDGEGMHIGEPFRNVTGILTGSPVYVAPTEIDRIDGLFKEERVLPGRNE